MLIFIEARSDSIRLSPVVIQTQAPTNHIIVLHRTKTYQIESLATKKDTLWAKENSAGLSICKRTRFEQMNLAEVCVSLVEFVKP